jgi:predicted PurR-regulated permease PerM
MTGEPGSSPIVRQTFLVLGVVILALLFWKLSHVFVLAFAAILFAIILRSIANLFERFLPVSTPWTLLLAGLLITAVVALFFFLLGIQIKTQLANLIESLPEYISALGDRLGVEDLEETVSQRLEEFSGSTGLLGTAAGYTSVFLSALTSLILIVITGIYLASQPRLYFHGFLKLIPQPLVANISTALEKIGHALQLWLIGQLVSMVIIAVITTVGLLIIGVPSALALGFLAGVAEFVPILGPVLASIPAILLAFSEGGTMVYWVVGLYIVIQQLESYVIMPLVQRRAVQLPPVLTLLAIVAFGLLFGVPGVLLGAPLTVVALVAVEQLYVRATLGKDIQVAGDSGGDDAKDDETRPGHERDDNVRSARQD